MKPSLKPVVALAIVLAVALAARGLGHMQMADDPDTYAPIIDAEAYLMAALRVPAGHDVSDEVYFQSPAYPALLGVVLWAGGVAGQVGADSTAQLPPAVLEASLRWGRRLNIVLGLVLVVLVWRLGVVLFGPSAGLVAGLLAALYGPFIFYEGHLLKVGLSLLFLPWAVLASARALRLAAPRAFLWCGLALGLGGVVQGHLMPLIPLAALALVVLRWEPLDRRAARTAAVALLVGAGLAVSPVLIRNVVVTGQPTLSGAQAGAAFYLCNNAANTVGIHEYNPVIRQVPRHESDDFRAETERLVGRSMTPAEISGYWRDRALDDIAADPARWLKTEWNKALALVSRYEAPDNTGYALGAESSWLLALTPVRFALVLPLALAGMLLAWRRRALVSASERSGRRLLLGALLGYACVVLVFCVTARYRMPVIPLLLVYAGSLVGSFRRGDQLTVVFALVVGVALTLAAEMFGPLTEQERNQHLAVRYRNRALVALERGDAAAAGTDLERALRAHPGALKVYTDLARLDFGKAARLMATGDTSLMATAAELRARALSRLATALDLGRDSNEVWVAVGLLAYEEGQDAVAVQALDVAVERQPHQRDARQYLVLSLLNVASDPGSESVVRAGLLARAYFHAVKLIDGEPERDDGYGLLALVLVSQGRTEEAAVAVERYDRRAVLREAAGLTRHLPDQPAFASLRSPP